MCIETMKKIILLISILSFFFVAKTQTITNVVAIQKGNEVLITYDLQCEVSSEISLYVSEKGDGNFIGPLKSVTGDVGNDISPGSKSITWNTLQDQAFITGENIVFRVSCVVRFGKFTDERDGKTYKAVLIGNQVSMTENLAYFGGNGCWINYADKRKANNLGYYYDFEKAQKVCPNGWHLPSKEEFEKLLQAVGNSPEEAFTSLSSNGISGFSAIYGGFRSTDGTFLYTDEYALFWTSTLDNNGKPWCLVILNNSADILLLNLNSPKYNGLSVRCFRN